MEFLQNYKKSQYNFLFEYKNNFYIYNSFSNALANIDEKYYFLLKDNDILSDLLSPIIQHLIKGNFIVKKDLDELEKFEIIFNSQKWTKSFNLTIAPTLNCNCNCKYCFQEKNSTVMSKLIYQKINELIVYNYKKGDIKDVKITWYGGEPLLEKRNIIEFYSKLSKNVNIKYLKTSIVTNGVLIDNEFLEEIKKYTEINNIQITFDGNKFEHNRKRHLKNGFGTYDFILNNIASLNDNIYLSLRINLDKKSLMGLEELFYDLKRYNIHNRKYTSIYFGHLRNYTDNVKLESEDFLTPSEFFAAKIKFTKKLKNLGFKIFLYPNSFPTCMLYHYNSFVIDPKGDFYKCWDLIGNKKAYMGNISNFQQIIDSQIYYKFMNYSPLKYQACKNCILLPVCLGGCPITRMGYTNIDKEELVCKKVENGLVEQLKYRIDSGEVNETHQ